MSDFSRRDWIKTVGAVSAGAMVPLPEVSGNGLFEEHKAIPEVLRVSELFTAGDIVDLYSTSEVFIPPRASFKAPTECFTYGVDGLVERSQHWRCTLARSHSLE